MAKKMKPNKLFDEVNATNADATKDEASNDVDVASTIGADANPLVGTGRISAEDIKKLEQYSAMEKSLALLSEEKTALEDKVAVYVEKLESLKDAEAKIKSLEKRCKELEAKAKDASRLEKEAAALRDENDQYLIKISELTFENASLTSQMSEIEKRSKANGNVNNQGKFGLATGMQHQHNSRLSHPGQDAYNPYANNGYGAWN